MFWCPEVFFPPGAWIHLMWIPPASKIFFERSFKNFWNACLQYLHDNRPVLCLEIPSLCNTFQLTVMIANQNQKGNHIKYFRIHQTVWHIFEWGGLMDGFSVPRSSSFSWGETGWCFSMSIILLDQAGHMSELQRLSAELAMDPWQEFCFSNLSWNPPEGLTR